MNKKNDAGNTEFLLKTRIPQHRWRSVQNAMRWAINKIGTVIYRISKDHEIVIPSATYAPWSKDKSFLQIFKVIENFTLVDKYRCFELWKLVEQCKKLEDGSIIEIGV